MVAPRLMVVVLLGPVLIPLKLPAIVMFNSLTTYFKTGPIRSLLSDSAGIRRLYERKRWSIFLSLVAGYGFFYTCRLGLSVTKKPLLDAGVLTVSQMGIIGSVMLYVYAIGKFVNGMLSDHANIRRFMSWALLLSALINLAFGFTSLFAGFVILWGLNGWFQSIGSAPSVVSICQWFSNRERGTRYGIWAGAMEDAEKRAKSLADSAGKAFEAKSFGEGADQVGRIRDEIAKIDAELADSSDWAFWDADYRNEMTMTRNELVNQVNAMEALNQKAKELSETEGISLDEAKAKLQADQAATGATKDLTDATEDEADAYEKAASAADKATDALKNLLGGKIDALGIQRDYEQSIRDTWTAYQDVIAAGGSAMNWMTNSINLTTEEGRELEQAFVDMAENGLAKVNASLDAGKLDEAQAQFAEIRDRVLDMATKMNMSKDATDKLLQSLGLTQSDWQVALDSSQIDEAIRKADTLRSKMVFGAVADAWSATFGGAFDSGGVVPGPKGSPQLILAHGGETVLPTHKGDGTAGVAAMVPSAPSSGSGGITIIVNPSAGMNEQALAEMVGRELRKQARAVR